MLSKGPVSILSGFDVDVVGSTLISLLLNYFQNRGSSVTERQRETVQEVIWFSCFENIQYRSLYFLADKNL